MTRCACALVVALLASAIAPAGAAAAPKLSARTAVLVAPDTTQQLYGRGADAAVPIASTTKLMTALVTLEHVRLSKVFADPNFYLPPVDSQIGLAPGERMSVHDLMLAMLLPSADDAAYDLAYNVGHGSVPRFISMMNRRARQLGLTHTHYSTPIGLDTPGNYSSAADLVKLTAYLMRTQPFVARAVALPRAVLRTGNQPRVVINRNDLVGHDGINGVKTGHTLDAGYVLVASARRNGLTLLSAVLGTDSEQSRDQNTLALLNYGFSSFRVATPIRRGEVMSQPTVKDQSGKRATVIAATSLTRVIPRGSRVRVHLDLPRELVGPLSRHAVVGSAMVYVGNQRVARIPLLRARALPAASAFTLAGHFVTRPSTLVSLLVLLCLAAALAIRWRARGASGRGGTERA